MTELWARLKIQYRQKPIQIIIIGVIILTLLGVIIFQQLQTPSRRTHEPQLLTEVQTAKASSKKAAASQQTHSAASVERSSNQPVQYYVEIKGEVQRPNVYQVSEHARINDLVKLAGGLTQLADDRQINLAQPLQDGMSIYIPKEGEQLTTAPQPAYDSTTVGSSANGSNDADGRDQAPININQADIVQLQQISGVGPKKAADIVAYRETAGGFKSVDELTKVSGIGEKTLAKIKDQLCI